MIVVVVVIATTMMLVVAVAMFGVATIGFPRQSRIPIGAKDRTISVEGCALRYRDIPGSGIPIVFLHGSNLSMDEFDAICEGLGGRRLIGFDLPGFGGSDRPTLAYDIECHMRFFIAFLDSLGIDRVVLVGHSFGGTMAMWYSVEVPDRIAGIVVLQSPGPRGSMVTKWPKSMLMRPGIWNRLAFGLCNTWLYRTCYPDSIARQDLGITNSIFDDQFERMLPRIEQPTLLLMSRTDNRIPWWVADRYSHVIPNATLVTLPEVARHHAQRFCPAFVSDRILGFLEEIDPP